MQIFPIECKPGDRNIDPIRRDNYVKSLDNVYPSHYLLPCNEQPEVLKMLQKKAEGLEDNNKVSGKAIRNGGKARVTSTLPGR